MLRRPIQMPIQLCALLCLLAAASCSSAAPDAGIDNQARQPGSPAAIAAAALAAHTGGNATDVLIRSVEAVDFSDSSLGCPQPGMAYLQVITPGFKVIAELAGSSFDVRVAGGRGLVCEPRAARSPAKQR
jgi:hypothetical protein